MSTKPANGYLPQVKYVHEVFEILSERGDLNVEEIHEALRSEFSLDLTKFVVCRVLDLLSRKGLITRAWRQDREGLVRIYYKVITSPTFSFHIPKWPENSVIKRPLTPRYSTG